jgi:HPt (histidine-containing phosphotransfer) domain-containing protein
MMKDIQAQFRDRFVATARKRIAVMRDVIASGNGLHTPVQEFHSFAGEAGLLAFTQFVGVARDGETQAKRLHADPTPANSEAVLVLIAELERMLDELANAPV